MIADMFFLDLTPDDIVDKMWSDGNDASQYYNDPASSAEFAIAISRIFGDAEFWVLEGSESGVFFAYVVIESGPFDVSGWHATHQSMIDDNEFWSDYGYGEVTYRKSNEAEVEELMGGSDISHLINYLVGA